MNPLSLVNSKLAQPICRHNNDDDDSEVGARVRELLDANLRHCIRLNKLAKLKLLLATAAVAASQQQQQKIGPVNWQACLVLAIAEKRPAIVSYLVRELRVALPFYHGGGCGGSCGCKSCCDIRADPRCYQVYVLEIFPCAVAPMYVFSLDEDPMAYCLRMAALLAEARVSLARDNLLKAYKQSKRNISACISLILDQTTSDMEVRQLLLDDVEQDLIERTNRYSEHLGRTVMFAQFRLNKAVVHRATQTFVEAEFSAGSEFLGDMWSVIGFIKMLLVCAFAFAVLTPLSILFPHPRLIKFLRSGRILALMEVVSIATYMCLVLVGANTSSNDVQSIVCTDISDTYVQLQMFGLTFIIARIIDEAYNLSLMSGRQFYISMFDYLLSCSLALHFSSLMFLIVWSEDVNHFGATEPIFRQHLCDGNRSSIKLCQLLELLSSNDLAAVNTLMEPVFYINTVTAVGNLFLFVSLGNVFVWQKTMGVLAITVQSMMKDVAKFIGVLFLVFVTYTTAMTNLYRNNSCGSSAFGVSFSSVAIEFFWAMFGMTSPGDYKLSGGGATWDAYFAPLASVQFTGTLALILYASWMILGFVVCVNLLIAMLSVTFQRIQADKDNSWLFARTRRMLRFLVVHHHQLMPLPVPYNVASPLVFALHHLLSWIMARTKHGGSQDDHASSPWQEHQNASSLDASEQRRLLVDRLRDQVATDLRLERLRSGADASSRGDVPPTPRRPEEELLDDVFVA